MRRKILFDCLKNIPYLSGSFSRLCYSQCWCSCLLQGVKPNHGEMNNDEFPAGWILWLQCFYMMAILMITTLLASNPTIVKLIQYFGNWLILMTIMMTKMMKWRRDIIHNWINERHDDMRWCQHLQSLIAECYQTEAQWQCVLRLQWFQQ